MTEEKREILKKLEVGTTYSGVDVICRQYKEIERLHSIIKEVREYIENDMKLKDNFMIDEDGAKYLLEILDKDGDKE